MSKLDLELKEGSKYYLSKEVFKHTKLSISSVRLLMVLSTKRGLTVDGMDSNTKLWIAGDPKKYSTLKKLSDELVELGLINANGTGLDLKKDFVAFSDVSEIESCQNLRQVFIQCLKHWHKKGDIIVAVDIFKGLFGDTTRIINQNLKRAKSEYSWVEKHNKIYFHTNVEDKVQSVVNKTTNNTSKKFKLIDVETDYTSSIEEPSVDKDELFDDLYSDLPMDINSITNMITHKEANVNDLNKLLEKHERDLGIV